MDEELLDEDEDVGDSDEDVGDSDEDLLPTSDMTGTRRSPNPRSSPNPMIGSRGKSPILVDPRRGFQNHANNRQHNRQQSLHSPASSQEESLDSPEFLEAPDVHRESYRVLRSP